MRYLKPTNNAQRNTVRNDYLQLTPKIKSKRKGRPRKLFEWLPTNAGRNSQGKITAPHRKGGHKKIYPRVSYKSYIYENSGEGIIKSIEYSPYHTGFISFISWRNGACSFIITPQGLKVGDKINTKDIFQAGNSFPLGDIPTGTLIYNLELRPKGGSKLIRAAGNYGTVMGKSKKGRVLVKLPSKEVREFLPTCWATIGKVSNPENKFVRLGKAGAKNWRGWRPKVRPSAMNPNDHPFGGGEGKAPLGRPNKLRGKRTRRKNKLSNKFIALSRHQVKARKN